MSARMVLPPLLDDLTPAQQAVARTMPEAVLQANITALVRTMGGLVYHTRDSRGCEKGFPDLVIVVNNRTLFAELKSARGMVTAEQREWLRRLTQAGGDTRVWRPKDWLTWRIHHDLAGSLT